MKLDGEVDREGMQRTRGIFDEICKHQSQTGLKFTRPSRQTPIFGVVQFVSTIIVTSRKEFEALEISLSHDPI
jgi:hypothetical protein